LIDNDDNDIKLNTIKVYKNDIKLNTIDSYTSQNP